MDKVEKLSLLQIWPPTRLIIIPLEIPVSPIEAPDEKCRVYRMEKHIINLPHTYGFYHDVLFPLHTKWLALSQTTLLLNYGKPVNQHDNCRLIYACKQESYEMWMSCDDHMSL